MKKRFIYLTSIAQLISLCSHYLVFADNNYIKNFSKRNTYTQNQFTDVNSEWFASSVQQAYETGLMYGDSDTTFNPNGNIDNAAVITIAARLHSIYNHGSEEFDTNALSWYDPYIKYAISNGICDSGIDPNAISTRGFFAGIIGNATDSNIFTQKNTIEDGALSDVTGWYSNTVYNFYRSGILSGNDKYGTFSPDSPITRAEVAAILSRIVKPSERVNVTLAPRPVGTYTIMNDDGSLAAFKQRAIVANLKVLLNGETQGDEWQNDIWTSEHAAIPGNNIHVSYSDIERKSDNDLTYIFVPNKYFGKSDDAYTMAGGWSLYTGFRSYLSEYTGSMPDGLYGDLYLTKPEVVGYTETHTYSDYTGQAQYLIDNVSYTPIIDSKSVTDYINENYGSSDLSIKVGYLSNQENDWYITINKDNMYLPSPRDNNANQTEFVFTPESAELQQWCKNSFGKYVIALVADELKTPAFLAEISGYPAAQENASIKRWNYSDNNLTIQWNYPQVNFVNPIIAYPLNKINDMRDVTGLSPVKYIPAIGYFKDDIYAEKYFNMDVEGDNIRLLHNGKTILLTLNSDKAIIDGFKEEYNTLGDFKGYKDTGTGQTVTVTAPKRLYDISNNEYVYYLPPKFITDTLFSKTTTDSASSVKTEEIYKKDEEKKMKELETLIDNGYAKVCHESRSDWTYYLEGHNNIKFRFGKREGIEGYAYEISKTYDGPHIGFNLDSKKACVQVWYNGSEYGEQVINIPEPKEYNNEIYLPVDEILDALEEDGQGFERKKI